MPPPSKSLRLIQPKLWTAIGAIAAAGLAVGQTAYADTPAANAKGAYVVAQGGEGGEGGEKKSEAERSEADFLAALGAVEGHLRAGVELYATGDSKTAQRFIGQPALKKYKSVARSVEKRGFGDLETKIMALAQAAEHGKPLDEIRKLFGAVEMRIDAVSAASPGGSAERLKALAQLIREAPRIMAKG